MSVDPATVRTRRAVLGAALGGAAAVAASTVRPLETLAADGDPALLGAANTSTAATSFENTGADGTSLAGTSNGDGIGVSGVSATGTGVSGASTDTSPTLDRNAGSRKTGVLGTAGDTAGASVNTDETGVYGFASLSPFSSGVWGESTSGYGVLGSGATGVYGDGYWGVYATGTTGVIGDAGINGVGVYGFTGSGSIPEPTYGVGVYARAESTAQTALQVVGKVRFSRSGRASVSAHATSRKVPMAGVTSSSYVIATMQTNVSGLYVRGVTCGAGYFNIWLSKAPGKTVYIAYLVIN
jgi:hypothetical protein